MREDPTGRPWPIPGSSPSSLLQRHSPPSFPCLAHWHSNPCKDIGAAAMSKRWAGFQGGREIPEQLCRDLIHIVLCARPRFGTLNSTRRLENHQVQTKQSQVLKGASLPATGGALKHRGSAGDLTLWHPSPLLQAVCTHTSSHSQTIFWLVPRQNRACSFNM